MIVELMCLYFSMHTRTISETVFQRARVCVYVPRVACGHDQHEINVNLYLMTSSNTFKFNLAQIAYTLLAVYMDFLGIKLDYCFVDLALWLTYTCCMAKVTTTCESQVVFLPWPEWTPVPKNFE